MNGERWLIVGCGYVGMRVAERARAAGHEVLALTRSPSRFAELKALGVAPCLGHWLEPNSLIGLPKVDRILVAVPHRIDESTPRTVELAEETHAVGLRHLLDALPAGWRRIVYLSTTGVYGQSTTEWVDEQTPVCPTRIGPRIAIAAEEWLRSRLTAEQGYCVLRLAGIYGRGRIPLVQRLRRGEPLMVPSDGYLNLAHVSDIARIVCVSMERTLRQSMYLFSDGHPVLRKEFYRHLVELCGVADPAFVEPDGQDAKARRATDKRISAACLLSETGFVLDFPSYRSGLVDAINEP